MQTQLKSNCQNVVDEQLQMMVDGIAAYIPKDCVVEYQPFTEFSGIPGAFVIPCVVDPDFMH